MIIDIKELNEFEEIIGYSFKNIEILEKSLTHSSYSNEDKSYSKVNNERLEFLGDKVLGCIANCKKYNMRKNIYL